MRSIVLSILVAILFALGMLVGHANTAEVRFDYLAGSTDISLVSLLLFAFGVGVGMTLIAVAGRLLALSRELRRARRQLRDTDTELKSLRNLPMQAH